MLLLPSAEMAEAARWSRRRPSDVRTTYQRHPRLVGRETEAAAVQELLERRPDNLPTPPTPLVGRETEAAAVQTSCSGGRHGR